MGRSLNQLAGFAYRQLVRLLANLPYAMATCVPRDRRLWLFGAWYGEKYADNPKYLFLHALQRDGVRPVWLTKNRDTYDRLRGDRLPVAYSRSLRGVWLQLRSGVVVFTHSVPSEFSAFLIASRVFRVQAWHGIPLKKIGYDDEKSPATRAHQRRINRLHPYRQDRCDLFLAAGPEDAPIYRSAFTVAEDRVVMTGLPRNDALFRPSAPAAPGADRVKRILYMPTFRGAPGSEFPLLAQGGFDYAVHDATLGAKSMQLEIRLHPVQRLSDEDARGIESCANIKLAEPVDDIYDALPDYDALITDYSSVAFDFALTGKPVYMAPFDLETYLQNDRSMYFPYAEICPSDICRSWEELLDRLGEPDHGRRDGINIVDRFHRHQDGHASARAFDEIARRVL